MRDFDDGIARHCHGFYAIFSFCSLQNLSWSSQFELGKDAVSSALQGWTLSSSLLLAGFPALLYAMQGVLTYIGYQNTDSVSENGSKTMSVVLVDN